VYDYFDAEHLEYVSASVAPTRVDAANGTVYRDRGTLNTNATSTINVTFQIKDNVQPGTEISNAAEHKLNISNQCECAQDTIPENNTDTEVLVHDLALIKTLNVGST